MGIEECTCPHCNNKLLYFQSILANSDIKYCILCHWCNFEFGSYDTKDELLTKFKSIYGGK